MFTGFTIFLFLCTCNGAVTLALPATVRKFGDGGTVAKPAVLKSLGDALQMSGISCQPDTSGNGTEMQCLVPSRETIGRSEEYWIKREIFQNYDRTTRPVVRDSASINCSVAMSLFHILDTNEKYQTISALVSIRMRWKDEFLSWNRTAFNNVSVIWVPSSSIWTPDIVIANSAEHYTEPINMNAKVDSSGDVLWMYPSLIKVYCPLDVRLFPFDSQACNVTFYSWTYSGDQIDLRFDNRDESAIYFNSTNQEWYVDAMTASRNEKVYACCKEVYPDITFTIHMRRRSLFYILSLIFPCVLIYLVSFLGFFLAPETGDKVHLEITILLALVVFLMIVGEVLPPSPDAVPILGILYSATMVMVSIALVFNVIVTNLHTRALQAEALPKWLESAVKFLRRGSKQNRFSIAGSRRIRNGSEKFARQASETSCGTTPTDRAERGYYVANNAGSSTQKLLLGHHSAMSAPHDEDSRVANGNASKTGYGFIAPHQHPHPHPHPHAIDRRSLRHRPSLLLPDVNDLDAVTWQEAADCANSLFFYIFVALSILFVVILTLDIMQNTRAVLK